MLIKPLERSTGVVQVHQNKQEHKNVFFLFYFLILCYLLSDKVLWNKVKGAHTVYISIFIMTSGQNHFPLRPLTNGLGFVTSGFVATVGGNVLPLCLGNVIWLWDMNASLSDYISSLCYLGCGSICLKNAQYIDQKYFFIYPSMNPLD